MVDRRSLLVVSLLALIAVLYFPVAPALADGSACTPFEVNSGTCVTAGVGDDDVTLGIDLTQPGSPQQPGGGNGNGNGDGVDEGSAGDDGGCKFPVLNDKCQGFGPGKTVPGAPVVPTQPVTLTDIANFRPVAGVAGMQPNGWMIVGLDTNFYSTGGTQVVDGMLLGTPASVRFTPVGWRWSYGDGTTATLATPGGTWKSQGVEEFDATSGSHIYRAPGTYIIDLAVIYAVEYRFAVGPWSPLNGTLAVQSNRLTATAGDATTVLVERECTANPRGPGC